MRLAGLDDDHPRPELRRVAPAGFGERRQIDRLDQGGRGRAEAGGPGQAREAQVHARRGEPRRPPDGVGALVHAPLPVEERADQKHRDRRRQRGRVARQRAGRANGDDENACILRPRRSPRRTGLTTRRAHRQDTPRAASGTAAQPAHSKSVGKLANADRIGD